MPPLAYNTQHIPTNYLPGMDDQALFHPLISALTLPELRKPLVPQLAVARAILQRDPAAFARAGCASYNDYFLRAQERGLVVLGLGDANMFEWMTLSPALQALVSGFAYDDSATSNIQGSLRTLTTHAGGAGKLGAGAHPALHHHPAQLRALPKAFWHWEKERRKKVLRAATAAVVRAKARAPVGGGLVRFLDGAEQADAIKGAAGSASEAVGPEAGEPSSTSAVMAPASASTSPSTPPASPSDAPVPPVVAERPTHPRGPRPFLPPFTRYPPLAPLPADLFAPLTRHLVRPLLQDAVLLSLSRSGEADAALRAVGAANWREYVERAEVSGVVELGWDGKGRERWIGLPSAAPAAAEERTSPAASEPTERPPIDPPSSSATSLPFNTALVGPLPSIPALADSPASSAPIGFATPSASALRPDSPA